MKTPTRTPTRICEVCGSQFTRNTSESNVSFLTRRYCQKTCYYAIRKAEKVGYGRKPQDDPLKLCKACGVKLTRKPKEVPSHFDKRTYCSVDCGQNAPKIYGGGPIF